MSANIRETRCCVGFHKQSALQTALAAADCWSLLKTNPSLASVDLRTESNAAWIGKDDEFATQNYPTNWDVAMPFEGYLTSEKAAMMAAFGLGKVVKAVAGDGWKYTCTPLDPLVDGIEMPSTTFVEAIRQGVSTYVIDRALVGMCCEEFGFQFNSGPGLQNARCTSQWPGSGKVVTPSAINIPVPTAEHMLPGYSVALSIQSNDVITAKSIQQFAFGWKNNIRLDSGFYPGSGVWPAAAPNAQIRGRMEHGDRAGSFSAVMRLAHGSPEIPALLAQTEGTIVLTVTGAEISAGVYHKLAITLARVVFKTAQIADAEGIVTVAVDTEVMKHSANGLVTIEVTTDQDEILELAA